MAHPYETKEQLIYSLLELSTANISFGQIVQRSSELLGNPLIVIDTAYRTVAHSKAEFITDTIWSRIIKKGYCSEAFIQTVEQYPEIRKGKCRQEAYEVFCQESPTPKMVCSLCEENHLYGQTILLGCLNPFKEEDFDALEQVSRILIYRWRQLANEDFSLQDTHQSILQGLLAGEVCSHAEGIKRLGFFNMSISEQNMLLGIEMKEGSEKKSKEVIQNLDLLFQGDPSVYYQGYEIYFTSPQKIKGLQKKLEKILTGAEIQGGTSLAFRDLSETPWAFEEMMQSIQLGMLLERDMHFHQFYRLQIFKIFQKAEDIRLLERILPAGLLDLYSYDEKTGSNLLETLEMWLHCGGSIQQTSEHMFLHRNTVSYRIERIRQLTDIHLDDFDERKRWILAIYALRWIKAN